MKNTTSTIPINTVKIGKLFESLYVLSAKGNADEGALSDFLKSFEPILQEILRGKKILKESFGNKKIFYIFNKQIDCEDYIFRRVEDNYDLYEKSEYSIKQISLSQFIKQTNGKYMNFNLYSIGEDGCLIFDPKELD